MKKRIFATILAICLICSTFVFAQEDTVFHVIPYDFDIFWTGNHMEYDSPILLVNGQTYVPLRDWSESIGMDVHWDGKAREIIITESDIELEDVFYSTFGFDLPPTSEIVNYAYGRYGRDVSMHAKIFFEKSDLESMKKKLDGIGRLLTEDDMDDEEIELINMSKMFDWWDITSPKDATYTYFAFMEGLEIVTYPVWGLICEVQDSDGYYLYISH